MRSSKTGGKAEAPLLPKEEEGRDWKEADTANLQMPTERKVDSASARYEA